MFMDIEGPIVWIEEPILTSGNLLFEICTYVVLTPHTKYLIDDKRA